MEIRRVQIEKRLKRLQKKRSITVARTRLSDASFCIEGLGIYLQNGNLGNRYPGQTILLESIIRRWCFPVNNITLVIL